MSAMKKLLVGTASVAALLGMASPVAAQYYPGNGYGNNYGNNVGGAIGQVINGVISATQYGGYQYGNYGYGQSYGYGGRTIQANVAVQQCAGSVEARLNGNRGGYGGGYGSNYGYNSYGAGAGGRVTGITSIEPRNNGALRVHGLISTNNYGGGYNGGYGGGYGGYNGYGGGGYNGGAYGGGGYNGGGYGGGGYNGGGYGAPNLSFTCKVDYSGRVIDLNIEQMRRDYGYRGW